MKGEETEVGPRTPAEIAADKENRGIAERIELGIAYHEPVTVRFTDRNEHIVQVYVLNTRQFRGAIKKSCLTLNQLQKFSEVAKRMSEQAKTKRQSEVVDLDQFDQIQDFLAEVASVAVKEPADILSLLAPGEELKIGAKALEITSPPKT